MGARPKNKKQPNIKSFNKSEEIVWPWGGAQKKKTLESKVQRLSKHLLWKKRCKEMRGSVVKPKKHKRSQKGIRAENRSLECKKSSVAQKGSKSLNTILMFPHKDIWAKHSSLFLRSTSSWCYSIDTQRLLLNAGFRDECWKAGAEYEQESRLTRNR